MLVGVDEPLEGLGGPADRLRQLARSDHDEHDNRHDDEMPGAEQAFEHFPHVLGRASRRPRAPKRPRPPDVLRAWSIGRQADREPEARDDELAPVRNPRLASSPESETVRLPSPMACLSGNRGRAERRAVRRTSTAMVHATASLTATPATPPTGKTSGAAASRITSTHRLRERPFWAHPSPRYARRGAWTARRLRKASYFVPVGHRITPICIPPVLIPGRLPPVHGACRSARLWSVPSANIE